MFTYYLSEIIYPRKKIAVLVPSKILKLTVHAAMFLVLTITRFLNQSLFIPPHLATVSLERWTPSASAIQGPSGMSLLIRSVAWAVYLVTWCAFCWCTCCIPQRCICCISMWTLGNFVLGVICVGGDPNIKHFPPVPGVKSSVIIPQLGVKLLYIIQLHMATAQCVSL